MDPRILLIFHFSKHSPLYTIQPDGCLFQTIVNVRAFIVHFHYNKSISYHQATKPMQNSYIFLKHHKIFCFLFQSSSSFFHLVFPFSLIPFQLLNSLNCLDTFVFQLTFSRVMYHCCSSHNFLLVNSLSYFMLQNI